MGTVPLSLNRLKNKECCNGYSIAYWVLPGLKKISYSDHLRALQLPTLIYRRLSGELVKVTAFKCINIYMVIMM